MKPSFSFWTRCKSCNAPLDRKSSNVNNGIIESPYCNKCASFIPDQDDLKLNNLNTQEKD
jgi:uncharacterized protein with PIN domain